MGSDLINEQDLRDVDLVARVEIARKVGRLLHKEDSDDTAVALQLARILVEDVSVSVREALAKELRSCSFLPRDIVERITQDIDQVTMPFLIASEAVDDDYLEKIVRQCSEGVQEAIAGRDGVSEQVSFAICDIGSQGAVDVLVDNETSIISERAANRAIERFHSARSLMERLSNRPDFPASVVENIIFKVSKQYAHHLSDRFKLAADYGQYLTALASREVFAVSLEMSPLSEIMNYFRQLHEVEGLTSDVLLGHLQNGHFRLFTAAMAVLIERPFEVVEQALSRGDRGPLSRMFDKLGYSRQVAGVLLISFDRLFGRC